MRVHVIVDGKGNLVASGPTAREGPGPKVQLRAGPGQVRHELELPGEFESKSPVDLHKKLAASELKQYIVASQRGTDRR
jgi:hypothetical protein